MRSADWWTVDDGERERWFFESDGTLHVVRDSLSEDRIMAENQALRSMGVGRSGDWYRPTMRMSIAQYEHLCREYPAFRPGGDQAERKRVIERICRDPDYRNLVLGKP